MTGTSCLSIDLGPGQVTSYSTWGRPTRGQTAAMTPLLNARKESSLSPMVL